MRCNKCRRTQIERYDAAYVRTMRESFGGSQDDALLYHIVLNTARVSIDACVKAVCDLTRSPVFQDDASLRSALADKLLEARVSTVRLEHVSISMAPAGVTVSAINGRVTLTGTTSSGKLRATAEQIVREIPGVNEIDNRIVSMPSRGTGL